MPSWFRPFVLWLHLLGVMLWIGGLLFHVLVVLPLLARHDTTVERLRLSLALEARFRRVMWPAVGLVLFTGLGNLLTVWHATVVLGGSLPTTFAWVLGAKMLLVLGMVLLLFFLQIVIQPRRLAVLSGPSHTAHAPPVTLQRLQRLTLLLYLLILVLGAAVLWCGVLLRNI